MTPAYVLSKTYCGYLYDDEIGDVLDALRRRTPPGWAACYRAGPAEAPLGAVLVGALKNDGVPDYTLYVYPCSAEAMLLRDTAECPT